jgi:hypothetical protein
MGTTSTAPTRRLHPAWWALLAGLVVLLVAFLPVLWAMWKTPPAGALAVPVAGTPWDIESRAGQGTRVFGLDLPGTTLADVRQRWGDDLRLALMATRGQPPALEAYVESVQAGGVAGRLLFTADAAPQDLQRWRDAAPKEEPVSADTRRITLTAAHRDEALRTPLLGIGFIPAAQLDSPMLRQRFGAPAQVISPPGQPLEHWLYPALGLAIVLDAKGRELLQYVAPADFERLLRAPLLSPSAPASTPASGPPG